MGKIDEVIDVFESELGIPEEVANTAVRICEEYTDCDAKGQSLYNVAGASVVVASWMESCPYTYSVVRRVSDEIGTGMARSVKDLKKIYDVKSPTPEDYINKVSKEMDLEETNSKRAAEIVSSEAFEYGAVSPANIAAAAISYYTDATVDYRHKIGDIAECAGVTIQAMREASEEIARTDPSAVAGRLIDAYEKFGFIPTEGRIHGLRGYPPPKTYKEVFGSLEEAFEFAGFADFEAVDSRSLSKEPTEEDYINKILTDLDLDEDYAGQALGLLESARASLPVGGELPGTPRSQAASAIYILSDGLSQGEAASPVGYTRWAVSKHYRDIAELAGEDIQTA